MKLKEQDELRREELRRNVSHVEAVTRLTLKQMSNQMGLNDNYLSEAFTPKGKVSKRGLDRFLKTFENFLAIEPPMTPPNENIQLLDVTGKLIPLGDRRTLVLPDYDRLIAEFFMSQNRATHFYRVEDLTMHAIFYPGDLLLLVKADTSIIISGELFVIQFNNGKSVVRYVHHSASEPGKFDLHAYNKSAGVTPGIPKELIKGMYKIVHLSRQFESAASNSVISFQTYQTGN